MKMSAISLMNSHRQHVMNTVYDALPQQRLGDMSYTVFVFATGYLRFLRFRDIPETPCQPPRGHYVSTERGT